jgi:lipopolysaccharide exporter
MSDLNRKMAKGAAWLVLFRLTERGIGFVSTLILARLLVPADFGLVAMATSMLAALELLGAFSFDLALIQNQKAERRHYDTAWTFAVAFGVFKAVMLCLLAAPAAAFFAEPRIESLMYVLALCTLVAGFDNIGIVAFQKDLQLHKEFWLGLTRKLVGFAVTVTLAFWLRNYWALIAGILATRVTALVLSYAVHPFRPRLSWAGAGELFGFSKWLLLNNFLIFINNRGTDFVIGKLSGARALGLYSVSYEIANLPTTELVWPISRAIFPGYSRIAHDRPLLGRTFLQVIGLVALLTIPAGALIGLAAESFVLVLLGPKWVDTIALIQVLAVFGIVRSLHGPTGSVYVAIGRPRVVAGLQAVQLGLAIGMMLLLVPRLGVIGAAWAMLAGALVAAMLNYAMALRELHLRLAQLAAVLWRPTLGALVMAASVASVGSLRYGVESTFGDSVFRLASQVLVGVLTYVGTVLAAWWLCRRPAGAESQVLGVLGERFGWRLLPGLTRTP